jgi:circadian clock protein KaiC
MPSTNASPAPAATPGAPTSSDASTPLERLSTGIAGLDEVLGGGVEPERAYLLRGGPGAGKTILGAHFLTADTASEALFITLGEPGEQVRAHAARLGFDLEPVSFLNLAPEADFFQEADTYDIFSPSEVEREPAMEAIVERVEETRPARVFVDSMTQFRYLAASPEQFRKQVLSFVRFLTEQGATVLFTSESSPEAPDHDLQFLSDGILELRQGENGRFITVPKFRGGSAKQGPHGFTISATGITVYPRLAPDMQARQFTGETVSTGVPEMDQLLNGGIERGTTSIVSGPAGVGKTTLGLQFVKEAAGRGERSVVFNLEEEPETMIHRCEAINIPIQEMVERDTLALRTVRPWNFSIDRFSQRVRREVEEREAGVIMIDSLTGLQNFMRKSAFAKRLQALTKYLVNKNVTVFFTDEVSSVTGDFTPTASALSYVADNIVFLRYLEMKGELRKAIGVLKKRAGNFENTLREFAITQYGLKVGEPLTELRGILQGTPEFVEDAPPSSLA